MQGYNVNRHGGGMIFRPKKNWIRFTEIVDGRVRHRKVERVLRAVYSGFQLDKSMQSRAAVVNRKAKKIFPAAIKMEDKYV